MIPRVCILKVDGTNCDGETAHAFERAGGVPEIVLVNQLRAGSRRFNDYQILALPGGFSYGDDVASGKILAIELVSFLKDSLQEFVEHGGLVIGICNGFQVLVRTGLLPFRELGTMRATLTNNDSGRFECRWINVRVEPTPCVFTHGLSHKEIALPVAHGEGKFFADDATLKEVQRRSLVVMRYSEDGVPTSDYPANPNGSLAAIAGVCDSTGRIFGLMPHPERFLDSLRHPHRRSSDDRRGDGLAFFENAVRFVQKM